MTRRVSSAGRLLGTAAAPVAEAGAVLRPVYVYRGDRWSDERLKGAPCVAVRRADGKCVRGRNGSMLVEFGAERVLVLGRQLRKL